MKEKRRKQETRNPHELEIEAGPLLELGNTSKILLILWSSESRPEHAYSGSSESDIVSDKMREEYDII